MFSNFYNKPERDLIFKRRVLLIIGKNLNNLATKLLSNIKKKNVGNLIYGFFTFKIYCFNLFFGSVFFYSWKHFRK